MFHYAYKQKLTLKKISGSDEYSAPIVSESKNVLCRVEFDNILIRNTNGIEVTANAKIQTTESIDLQDVISYQNKDYEVIKSSPICDLDGNILYYEVYI